MSALFLWRLSSSNIGDRNCGWPLWFDIPYHISLCLDQVEANHVDISAFGVIIVGGGVIPEPVHFPHVHAQLTAHPRVMAAGVGRNEVCGYPYPVLWRHGENATPCPSCMSRLFDMEYEIKHDTVYYENADIEHLHEQPKLGNHCGSMLEAIEFLGSGATVITSSYHGAYWAALLGRNVILNGERGKFNDPCWHESWFNLPNARARAIAGYREIARYCHVLP